MVGRDYPDFYPRLYAFLDRDSLHMKYRSRFLRLLERFMNSTYDDRLKPLQGITLRFR